MPTTRSGPAARCWCKAAGLPVAAAAATTRPPTRWALMSTTNAPTDRPVQQHGLDRQRSPGCGAAWTRTFMLPQRRRPLQPRQRPVAAHDHHERAQRPRPCTRPNGPVPKWSSGAATASMPDRPWCGRFDPATNHWSHDQQPGPTDAPRRTPPRSGPASEIIFWGAGTGRPLHPRLRRPVQPGHRHLAGRVAQETHRSSPTATRRCGPAAR